MTPKRRINTNAFKWLKCDKCECIVRTEDSGDHLKECPPPNENWSLRFIRNSVLHSIVDIYNPKGNK